MLLGVTLQPGGDIGKLADDVGGFQRVLLHIEQRKFDLIFAILAGLAVVTSLHQSSITMGDVQLPSAIPTDDAFENGTSAERIILVRIYCARFRGNQIPDVLPIDCVLGKWGMRQVSKCRQ